MGKRLVTGETAHWTGETAHWTERSHHVSTVDITMSILIDIRCLELESRVPVTAEDQQTENTAHKCLVVEAKCSLLQAIIFATICYHLSVWKGWRLEYFRGTHLFKIRAHRYVVVIQDHSLLLIGTKQCLGLLHIWEPVEGKWRSVRLCLLPASLYSKRVQCSN